MTQRQRHEPARRHRSKRPYRDSALAYAGLGALVFVIAYATGSGLRAVAVRRRGGVRARDRVDVVADPCA